MWTDSSHSFNVVSAPAPPTDCIVSHAFPLRAGMAHNPLPHNTLRRAIRPQRYSFYSPPVYGRFYRHGISTARSWLLASTTDRAPAEIVNLARTVEPGNCTLLYTNVNVAISSAGPASTRHPRPPRPAPSSSVRRGSRMHLIPRAARAASSRASNPAIGSSNGGAIR
jgi:hypothetical protein